MKIIKTITLLLVIGTLLSFVNQDASSIELHGGDTITWKGKKVTGSHEGTIALKSGGIEYNDKGMPTGGSFVIDMNSITCTDLGKGGANKLVGHLKSPDFFGVAAHPEATFKVTAIKRDEVISGLYNMTGDLTIKGISHEIKFPFTVTKDHDHNVASGTIKVDRTKYDIKYGSGKFFDGLGDKMIDDEFELNVRLVSK